MELVGILHCHSTYSYDAKLSLSELKELFQKNGVRFVCMTEHTDELTKERAMEFIAECERLSDDSFLCIPGFEVPYRSTPCLPARQEHTGEHAHILMIGTRAFHEVYAPTIDILKHWTADASFVVLAHPVRNQFNVDDGLLQEMDALEVWNQQYEGKRVPRVRSLKLFDSLHKTKPSLVATGGVDLHRREHFGAPFVTLNVDEFSESAILEKLKIGAFIVSSNEARFYGTLPNARDIIQAHRWASHFSVCVIALGKTVNKILASMGLSLPKWTKELVRRRI